MNRISVYIGTPTTNRLHPCYICKTIIPIFSKTIYISAQGMTISPSYFACWLHLDCWQNHLKEPIEAVHPAVHIAREMMRERA